MKIDHGVAEQFVRANWPALAAAAWRFHLSHGPGALVVEWSVVDRWGKDHDFRFQPHYVTETDSADFNSVIKRYDPQKAIVIAFSGDELQQPRPDPAPPTEPIRLAAGTALAAMTVEAVPPPPEAHRSRGH